MGIKRILGVGALLLPLLASCGDDRCWNCGYGPPPSGGSGPSGVANEISLGLVAGNFANNGLNSIIATSLIPTNANSNVGNLKTYLSTAAFT